TPKREPQSPNARDPCSVSRTQEAAAMAPGQRKQVTVLFADFAGFTAFTHRRDAEEVRDYMTSLWAQIDPIIAAHGGETEKHIGDAIMAIFGGRQAREDDPAQAVRAALAIQACLKQFQAQEAQPLE